MRDGMPAYDPGAERKTCATKPLGEVEIFDGQKWEFFVEDHTDNLNLFAKAPNGQTYEVTNTEPIVKSGEVEANMSLSEIGHTISGEADKADQSDQFDQIIHLYTLELPGLIKAYEESIRKEFDIEK